MPTDHDHAAITSDLLPETMTFRKVLRADRARWRAELRADIDGALHRGRRDAMIAAAIVSIGANAVALAILRLAG